VTNSSSIPRPEAAHFGAVAAAIHIAPTPRAVARFIQERPAAGLARASVKARDIDIDNQLGR